MRNMINEQLQLIISVTADLREQLKKHSKRASMQTKKRAWLREKNTELDRVGPSVLPRQAKLTDYTHELKDYLDIFLVMIMIKDSMYAGLQIKM